MKDKFYELEVLCSQELRELFEDLVFSLGVTCTQETAGGFIIRDEDELDEVDYKTSIRENLTQIVNKGTLLSTMADYDCRAPYN